MISVTRFNGTVFHVNALLIESIEETPDTLVTLITGKKFMIKESSSEVISSIQHYLKTIGANVATIKSVKLEEDEQ